ncbi:MAG: YabP/YqfC family sporulation protein [Clostridia bacterium]
MNNQKEQKTENKNQHLTLINKSNLTISGTNKVISIKPDLIQLDTNLGGVIIGGNNLELSKLDNETSTAEIIGTIHSIRYTEHKEKESLFRKIFK